jgi:DNA-binding beta-propeller fold protein YncE
MFHPRPTSRLAVAAALAAALTTARATGPAAAPGPAATPAPDESRKLVRDGLVIEFSLAKSSGSEGDTLREGDYAEARFKMTDATSGRPVPGLKPAAWLDMAGVVGGKRGETRACKDKVALYLQGSVGIRPMVDLNSYYLLVMNQDASVSVIDPVVSMTGNTSLFASIILKRPAADWRKSADERRLYLSMPKANEVAVVDSERFKVQEYVAAGEAPTRIALQGDGRYLWVGNDADDAARSGVTVIDAETLTKVAFVATGRGHHEIAFSARDRHAFVTNRADGTVSVVDVARLVKVKDLRTGPLPISIAASALSQAIYVADGKAGTIAVIDAEKLDVTKRIAAAAGLGPMRFSQDGRWGFVVNPTAKAVFVIDAADGTLANRIALDGKPYQVSVTRGFAYVRLLDSEMVKLVNLLTLGAGKKPTVQSIAAGQSAPQLAGDLSLADTVSPASTDAAVFVVNPADNTTYFYMEGMNAPMGSFGSYGHAAMAVTVVDRSLKELEPGVYGAKLRVPAPGVYDVAFLLDNPRVLHCFAAEASPNPIIAQAQGALAVQFLPVPAHVNAGTRLPLRMKLTDPVTGAPRTGLADVQVLYHRVPGGVRTAARAVEQAGGVYQAELDLTASGTWYALLDVPSLNLKPNELPFRGIVVRDAPAVKSASR